MVRSDRAGAPGSMARGIPRGRWAGRALAAPFLALALALGVACGRAPSEARCAQCGMKIEAGSRWKAGLTTTRGEALTFDTPRCMLRALKSPMGRGARDAWVLEYYGGRRLPAAEAYFVAGSNVLGPMGPDLVPVADRASAQRFAEDHAGRTVLRLGEIGPDQLGRM